MLLRYLVLPATRPPPPQCLAVRRYLLLVVPLLVVQLRDQQKQLIDATLTELDLDVTNLMMT
jgi:hypothetical protein